MTIESELNEIRGDDELLTAEQVVAWARAHPKSALYHAPEFQGWDSKKAAYQHWLWAARKLIAIHVTYADGSRKLVSLSIDRTRDKGGYRDIDDVLRDQGLHEIMLADALGELGRIEAKYERLMQLRPIWRAAAKVRQKATKKPQRRSSPAMQRST